jgi:hypothetical protein
VGAAFGIVSGILVTALFLIPTPSGTPEQQLANFNTNTTTWRVIGFLDVLLLLSAIPFAAYLRSVLEGRSPGTASAAAIMFVVGIVFGAGASLIQASEVGTLSGIYASTTASAADRAAAVIAATLLSEISMSLFSIVLLEGGIVLFSVTMLNSRIFANWVADVGVASGAVFILIFALTPFFSTSSFLGFLIFLAFLVLLIVWVFGSSAYLLRSSHRTPVAAPAPA